MHNKATIEHIVNSNSAIMQAYDHYVKFCTSKNLPYHNQFHTECMMINCWDAANWLLENSTDEIPTGFNPRNLIVAAIFHDFNHSGGEWSDADNVIQAKSEFLLFAGHYAYGMFTEDDIFEIGNIIGITQYPYTCEPTTISQKIIRDCDLMQSLEDNWEEMIQQGLRKEVSVKLPRMMTIKTFSKKNVEFLSGIKWYTSFGESKQSAINARIEEIKKKYL